MSEPRVLLEGLAYVESPRWHDDRLWIAHWGTDEIVAVGLDGESEVVGRGPGGFGWSIDWLPDGRLLTTGPGLTRHEADGRTIAHANLAALAGDWNEIVVDRDGAAFVNGNLFGPPQGGPSGIVARVDLDGTVRRVADALAFPNGMALTDDGGTLLVAESWAEQITAFDVDAVGNLGNRRVWAATPGDHPDGICLDADGAAWYADVGNAHAVRVREGGEVLETVELDRGAFACVLGGPRRRTLFVVGAEWRGFEALDEVLPLRTGRVFALEVAVPGAGRP
jgi:sugar lactone lactonase YvrE